MAGHSLHTVYLDEFYIDIFPVTNLEFWEFLTDSGYQPDGNWQIHYKPGTDNYPVRAVSYNDAVAYAEWCGKRLPTNDEWEAAARGYDERAYPWGDEWNSEYVSTDEYSPVDGHPENISLFGVREMIGNVWEWTQSPYFTNTSSGNNLGTFMILKGGSVNCSPELCKISERGTDPANTANASYGFRCAMDPAD